MRPRIMLFQKDDAFHRRSFYCKNLFYGRLFVWSMQLRGKNYLCLQFGIIYSSAYLCMKGDSFL